MGVTPPPRVAVVRLGCARNDVDADELEGRLAADGFAVADDDDAADIVLVNTCGFIAAAKKDSIDAVLAAADSDARVVVSGCLAERYGSELAAELPEASAVLSFDDYPQIGERLRAVLGGESLVAHEPRDRRHLLPISPIERSTVPVSPPGHATVTRRAYAPVMSVKLASGCDRRCTFCAIPAFRGAFVSRRPEDVIGECANLVEQGVREIHLVSENSTSYGKDLGDIRMLERLLPSLGQVPGLVRVRVQYLQPAEIRPGLIDVIAGAGGVASYFDLSFQHASTRVLRRMRRFGGSDDFLALLDRIRALDPLAGVRTNVIVGFPGEDEADVAELEEFLSAARLDAIGVFGYSDEDGTEAVGLDGHVPQAEVDDRVARISRLVDDLMAERARERVAQVVEVIVEGHDDGAAFGHAAHQGPDDGVTMLGGVHEVGDVVRATVKDSDGPDLVAAP